MQDPKDPKDLPEGIQADPVPVPPTPEGEEVLDEDSSIDEDEETDDEYNDTDEDDEDDE